MKMNQYKEKNSKMASERMIKLFVNDGTEDGYHIEVPLHFLLNEEMAQKVPEDNEGFYFFHSDLKREYLEKMIEYLRYFHEHPMDMKNDFDKPLRFALNEYLGRKPEFAFYQTFIQEIWDFEIGEGDRMIRHIMELINYMDPLLIQDSVTGDGSNIRSQLYTLLQLCCMKYASEIKGKSKEEVRRMFVLPKVETPTPSAGAGGTA